MRGHVMLGRIVCAVALATVFSCADQSAKADSVLIVPLNADGPATEISYSGTSGLGFVLYFVPDGSTGGSAAPDSWFWDAQLTTSLSGSTQTATACGIGKGACASSDMIFGTITDGTYTLSMSIEGGCTDLATLTACTDFSLSTLGGASIDVLGGNPGDLSLVATPLPATLPLLAAGLGGLSLLGWRGKRKAQVIAA